MKIQQIRNATIRIECTGKHFLIDPWFQKKGTGMSAPSPDPERAKIPSPTTELPFLTAWFSSARKLCMESHLTRRPDRFAASFFKRLRSLSCTWLGILCTIKGLNRLWNSIARTRSKATSTTAFFSQKCWWLVVRNLAITVLEITFSFSLYLRLYHPIFKQRTCFENALSIPFISPEVNAIQKL